MEAIRVISVTLAICCSLTGTLAGRAFPVNSENYATSLFQSVNPNLEWDPTNFLVDLSGRYANCKYMGKQGQVTVERLTPDGMGVGGMVDYARGSEVYSDAVQRYITDALQDWPSTEPFRSQMKKAERFGCSVQPGCQGFVVIACLFSPGIDGNGGGSPPDHEIENPPGKQVGQAFTEDQYKLTERIVGMRWDRSNFLENLCGFEIGCSMIIKRQHTFAKAKAEGKKRGMYIQGRYGSAPNLGSTEKAMVRILRSWKSVNAKSLGCSVIPDCVEPSGGSGMTVVVACLFSDKSAT